MRALLVLLLALTLAPMSGAGAAQADAQGPTLAADSATFVRGLLRAGRYADAAVAARRLVATEQSAGDPLRTGEAMDLLVESLWRGGKARTPEARAMAESSLAIKRRRVGPDHLAVAASLFQLGYVHNRCGEYQPALRAFEQSLRIRESALGPDDVLVAQSLTGIANTRMDLGEHVTALPMFQRALAIREGSLPPDDPDIASSVNNLANCLLAMGDAQGARRLYERALAIRERSVGPNHPDLAVNLSNLGRALQSLGAYEEARACYERALAIKERALGPEHPSVASTLDRLAELSRLTGDLATARLLFERALAIQEKALGPRHIDLANSLNNLGNVLFGLGDLGGARRLYERSLEIHESQLGKNSPALVVPLGNVARVLAAQGDRAAATRLSRRAVELVESADQPDPRVFAEALQNLGNLTIETDAAEAARLFERALRLFVLATGGHHRDVALAHNSLANALLGLRRFGDARAHYDSALVLWAEIVTASHPRYALTLRNLADLLALIGEPAAALDSALRAESIGRDHLRLMTRALPERLALSYAADRPQGLSLAIRLAGSDVDADRNRRALDAVIRSRAVVLDEMAARYRLAHFQPDPRTDSLVAAARDASRRLAQLVLDPAAASARSRPSLDAARLAKERAEIELAARVLWLSEERGRDETGLAEVERALPEDAALISYSTCFVPAIASGRAGAPPPNPRSGVLHYVALVLRPGGEPRVVRLGPVAGIDSLVARWSFEASQGPARRGAGAEAAYRRVGVDLRRRIWDPLSASLSGCSLVFVVPEGSLNRVNLAALPVGTGRYLVETGPTLHYGSAERDFVRASAPVAGRLLALGGPDFDAQDLWLASAEAVVRADSDPEPSGTRGAEASRRTPCDLAAMRFGPLPGTLNEVGRLAELWSGDPKSLPARQEPTVLTGRAATEAAFRRLAPGHTHLHLATHGFFLSGACGPEDAHARGIGAVTAPATVGRPVAPLENPLALSGIALAGANRRATVAAGEEDGILTAEEIAGMDLASVRWAVFSACETGTGAVQKGEGIVGLRRALRVAGAATTIMSLWAVDDRATRAWMESLYDERLTRGRSTPAAVRQASIHMLQTFRGNGRSTHPFYWGAFVAAGEWR